MLLFMAILLPRPALNAALRCNQATFVFVKISESDERLAGVHAARSQHSDTEEACKLGGWRWL